MKGKFYFVAVIVVSMFFVAAHRAINADELVGKWSYTISNVPPEYESGVMTFEQKEEKITGYVGETGSSREMKELKVDAGKVSFKMEFEGGLIDYKLTLEGEKLNGTVLTNYGEFPITAVRSTKD
ncbi:hypothetical protein [Dyadobacter sp. NIV53]|uniref:hypothetical protein n=1 Tax=Dyadobacter sp. NIV53 TaxID=2861765 RepID=UPI001C87F82B|nr:hypothetical protein [Dyadobacter sp. NIV53]